jgi:Fe-S-cluster containining protein
MGKDTVKFKCHSCGHCCTEVVCLPTPEDVRRIAAHTGKKPSKFLEFLTPEELEGVDDDDPTWLECQGEKYMMALKRVGWRKPQRKLRRGRDLHCFFLSEKTGYCKIYEARPILCRLYPFKLEESKKGAFKGFSLHDDVECPKHRDGVMETKPLYELYLEDEDAQEEYDQLVEAFNEDDSRGKRPEDFVKTFL